jgi:CheY-like chemotaxis protein
VQEQDVRILVAEDDPVNMLLITEVLSKMGYEVIKAGDGKEVLNLLQTVDPALIFMDINMPEMDGYMATRLIRELPGPKCAIPIIALTADAMKEDKERCVEAGMNGFVSKPFRREEIDKEVRRFVGV